MGRIKVSKVVKAEVDDLYRMSVADLSCPELGPNVSRVNVLECGEGNRRSRTEWIIEARALGFDIGTTWVQDNRWDDEARRCRFQLSPVYEGPIRKMQGVWSFDPHPKGAEMTIDMELEIEFHVLQQVKQKVAEAIVARNNAVMLEGIKSRAESSAPMGRVG